MGIDNFHNWLKDKYKNCFSKSNSKSKFDYIYIDINHLLHNSMSGIKSEEEFVTRLYKSLDLLFCNFLATKKVIIAIDGTSPYSKIILQRKRRSQGLVKLDVNKLTSIYLTPGTEFMLKVNNYIEEYIKRITKKYQYVNVNFEFISSDIPDEGEIKIFKKMIQHNKEDPFNTHLVIGNDADLVVLAVALKYTPNIHILVRHQGATEILSVDKMIQNFCNKISNLVISRNDWRSDFTLISLMMGNDYLPKLNYIKYDSIWKTYFSTVDKTKTTLISNKHFSETVIKIFFSTLINNISKQFQKFNQNKYNEDKVVNYLEGLLWCLNMYETGVCPMYDYVYKYKKSPSPADIDFFLQHNKNIKIEIPTSNTPPISTNIFTLLVMPKKAKKLIPSKYHKYMDTELKHIYESEECQKCIKLRAKMSTLHKKLHAEQGKKSLDKALDKDTENTRKLISNISSKFSAHKKEHGNDFSINDIEKIINLNKDLIK